jgi:molybdopterin converting factor small subunit
MQITFQYEAQLRQAAGCAEQQLQLPSECTLQQAIQHAAQAGSDALQQRLLTSDNAVHSSVLIFVNNIPVSSSAAVNHILQADDQVLLLPPISGG